MASDLTCVSTEREQINIVSKARGGFGEVMHAFMHTDIYIYEGKNMMTPEKPEIQEEKTHQPA
jgi:hypothetical protein